MIHVIVVKKHTVIYEGEAIGRFRVPICAAARWLIKNRGAERRDILATVRDRAVAGDDSGECSEPYLAMVGSLGWFADRTVKETDKVGPAFWRSNAFSGDFVAT